MRNRDRRPKEYAIATVSNGKLTTGGRALANSGNLSDGKYIVIKSSGSLVAIKTTSLR